MAWRQAAWAILFSPILVGSLLFVGVLIAWKLPMFCCERLRAVRYLPLAGLCYYGGLVLLAAVVFGRAWWETLVLAVLAILTGEWLLPDPVSFLVRPGRRWAVLRAIERVEAAGGPRALYGMVALVGAEADRRMVSVAIDTGCIPPGRRFFAVSDDGATIEELDFEYVAAAHGVHPWR